MAFRFRLQKVLDFRQRTVDQKSREVGQAARTVAGIQNRIYQVQSEVNELLIGPSAAPATLDIRQMSCRRSWLEHLETRLKDMARERSEAELELQIRRDALTRAWRDLEVLQKLKERQKISWQADQFRRENQDLDEIGQIRSDRQKRERLSLHREQLS